MTIQAINPVDNSIVKEYTMHTAEEIGEILKASDKAFGSWRKVSLSERAALMRKAGDYLRDNKKEFGTLMVREMGKPIRQAIGEVEKCAWVCDFYADNAGEFLKDEPVESDASESLVVYEPLGTILAVMPWNFPFWQVFRFAAPALMAGNTAVLKHASNVPGCA
ncbi:MAG TPA: aldehyde dehydrogenase family protein, partial [Cytophagaceae bacterium]